jgi:hypothetical protein
MNDIIINWQKLNKGIPRGKSVAEDRAPKLEETQKLLEYPDRRIKPIVQIQRIHNYDSGCFVSNKFDQHIC